MPRNPKLTYRGRHVDNLIQESDVELVGIDDQYQFPDTTTLVPLAIKLSQAQYIKILSALSVGAYIVSNDEAMETIELFLQLTAGTMDFCDVIADCIGNSAAVQAALSNYTTQQGGSAGAGTPDSVSPDANDNNLLPPGYTCDNDHLFGMSMEVVGMVHENTLELLQEIQSNAGQWLDLVNSLLDNIPVVELLGISTEVISWASASFVQDYESAWNTTTQQDIACELFCRIKDDCNLSWDDVWDTYLDVSLITPPALDTFEGWWDVIENAVFGSDKARVAGVGMLGLAAMRFGGRFAKWVAGIRTMKETIALAANATDSDWSILCTNCNPPNPTPEFVVLCAGGGSGGQNLTSLGGARWRAETTVRAGVPDIAITIGAVGGVDFQLQNVVISDSTNLFRAHQLANGSCVVNNNVPDSTPLLQAAWTWPNGTPLRAIEFDMLAT